MRKILYYITAILMLLTASATHADTTTDRALFLQARNALAQNDMARFQMLENQLRNYSLYPYLVYYNLMKDFPKASSDQITQFLRDYADTPLAGIVRYRWLIQLAEQKQWSGFLSVYQPNSDISLQCLRLQALWESGKSNEVLPLLPKFWLVGHQQPDACHAVFMVWKKQGGLTSQLIWQRAQLAMEDGNSLLAKRLASQLPLTQQKQIETWLKIRAKPQLVLNANLFKPLNAENKNILMSGILHWADVHPHQVIKNFSFLQKNYLLSVGEQQLIMRSIGIALARKNDPQALNWLTIVQPRYQDYLSRAWGIRNALLQQNWTQVNYWLAQLSPGEREESTWKYWQARALAATGRKAEAQKKYQEISHRVSYYGLLASEQLREPYHPSNQAISVSAQEMSAIEKNKAVQRARELYAVNLIVDSRREWDFATSRMPVSLLPAAAQYAYDSKWYDMAIVTLGKTKIRNAILLRFPLAYQNAILQSAKELSIEPAWIYSIMRQESIFMCDAKSSAGALGLMQLMPQTAKVLADNLRIPFHENSKLLDADMNIRLGSIYLRNLLQWYKGNIIQATAAYNAGPGNVGKWLPFYNKVPQDVWIEIIPFQETRDYIKNVLLGRAIYQERLKRN